MGVISAAVGGLGRLLMVPAGIALILMMLHVNADVVGRLLLNHPIPVTIEVVSYYYMVAVIFLPLAAVERADHHIAVDLLSQHFRGALRRWTLALAALAYVFAAHWSLSSIPMFLLMGYPCYHAQLTEGLFRAARVWLGGLPGGLGVASIWGAAMFSAVTGSSVACAAAMGRIAVPEMLK